MPVGFAWCLQGRRGRTRPCQAVRILLHPSQQQQQQQRWWWKERTLLGPPINQPRKQPGSRGRVSCWLETGEGRVGWWVLYHFDSPRLDDENKGSGITVRCHLTRTHTHTYRWREREGEDDERRVHIRVSRERRVPRHHDTSSYHASPLIW